ncbi:hypothetical protein F2P81_003956 [Scophthalmus maximus]|uniref:RNase H type-1 domain-containing protein n=1 Tax=Scophthalmus maximus TaxID=52904 RepID=A0A6A4TJZ9_SCOMX|nr:hypothetical protein F2P81_003956 [Scophthalmus maximus]
MMSFLGRCNYSRNYIPSYCDNTAILRCLILDKGVRNLTLPLDWSSEAKACFIQLKQLLAHYAVIKLDKEQGKYKTEEVQPLEAGSAQKAELVAVMKALQRHSGEKINLYTDSAYVHGLCHWELTKIQRGSWNTSTGNAVKRQQEVQQLAEAIMQPKELAVIIKSTSKRNRPSLKGK